jgi:hypothetical protein
MHCMTDAATGEPAPRATATLFGGAESEQRLRRLIRDAFEAARRGGRADWQQMTIAVLKNRLLTLTDRQFSENDYGERTISDLVRRLPDLLEVDDSTIPPGVRLLTDNPIKVAGPLRDAGEIYLEPARVRRDLWDSIVDYRSHQRYIWNGSLALREGEATAEATAVLILPTLTEVEMAGWREAFVATNSSLVAHDAALLAQLESWQHHGLGTASLPHVLRPPWNTELKKLVVRRILDWFEVQSALPPVDLLQYRPRAHDTASVDVTTSALRELVLRCVRVMTHDELKELRLPPEAVLRMRQ